jgi:hypothetical protein
MHSGSPPGPADPSRLRAAYAELSEEQKKRFCLVVSKHDPETFRNWFGFANCNGFTERGAASRPPGIGVKLDYAILKSDIADTLLRMATSSFCTSEFPQWIEYVIVGIKGATAQTISTALKDTLGKADAPFRGSEWAELFTARALLTPKVWLEVSSNNNASTAQGTAVSDRIRFEEHVAELKKHAGQIRKSLDALSVAKPIAVEKLHETLAAAMEIGARIRDQVSKLEGRPFDGDWQTLEDLEARVEKAVGEQAAHSVAQVRKARLVSIANALKSIARLNMKAASTRSRAEDLRKAAIGEIDAASGQAVPVEIPGQGDGKEWLRAVLGLDQAAFDALIVQLNEAVLKSLGAFLSEVETWERLTFAEELPAGLPPESTRDTASVAVTPNAKNTPLPPVEITSKPGTHPKETSPAIKPEAPPATDTLNNTAAVTIAPEAKNTPPSVTTKPERDMPPRETDPVPSVVKPSTDELPRTRPVPADSKDPIPGTKEPNDAVIEPSDIEGITKYAQKEQWIICAQYARLLDSKILPKPEIFETLGLLPYIRDSAGGIAESIRQRLQQADSPRDDIDVDQIVVWSASLIPACILVPYTNAPAYLRTLHWPEKLQALHQLSQAAIKLAESIPHLSLQVLRGEQPRAVWEHQLREISALVEQFEREAKVQTILYQPATEVWKYLWKQGAFAELSKLLRLPNGTGDRRRVQELLTLVTPGRSFDKLIQSIHAKHNPGAKVKIEARALPQFEGKSAPFRDIARRWLELTESVPGASDFVSERVTEFKARWGSLTVAVERAIASDPSIQAYAKSAIRSSFKHLHGLINVANVLSDIEPNADDVIARERLSVPGLRFSPGRDTDGDSKSQIAALRQSAGRELSLFDSASLRIKERDIHGARLAIALLEGNGVAAVDTLWAALDSVTVGLRNDLNSRLLKLRKQASNARLSGIIGEGDVSNLEAAFVILENSSKDDDNLDSVQRDIEARSLILDDQTNRGKELMLKKVRREVPDEKDRDRLERLISAEDVMTAQEYLSRLATGEKLPKEDGRNLQPFAGFSPERQNQLTSALASGGELDGLRSAIRSGGAFAGTSFRSWSQEARHRDTNWIETWLKVKGSARAEQERVEILLSSLGFNVQSVRTTNRGALQMSEASVEPLTDRTLCPIPRFGSLSVGSITIRHIWKWVDEETIVQAVGETAQQSQLQLVFFYGRLPSDRRLALSRMCRSKRRSFLVVDELLVSHLCGLTEGRLAAFFRGATPFTYADPFVTASSLVPPEMFYGREEELAALMSPDNGRCFVYGGRQLGKTALLREAERRFANATVNNFAVWIDLLDNGIGREHGPKAIWAAILREFALAPGFERPANSSRSDPDVPEMIEAWLNQNKDRRILLLLDEADRFLDEDAKEDFREARRLKGIMDRTSRRFKVVFAGLHNVQRTTQQVNHPLAHLGDPINVGALSQGREWPAAFALASEPLTALGVRFSSADLVSRILTICNFYPGLIQQFCSRLWRRLVERRIEGPPFTITEVELDEVYRDPELRKDIVGRFKLTLQLDPRYWHLAHIVALQFLEHPDEAEAAYPASQLRQLATEWWQEGFVKSSPEEFRSLLDEMCALGVLRLVGDKYSFRNANILLLLGSRGEVESELLSGPRKIVDYTPRSFRARRKKGESFLRRPLTLSEESRLSERKNDIAFIVGSTALRLDDVVVSLNEISANGRFHPLRGNVSNLAAFDRELTNTAAATRSNVEGIYWVWVPASLKWTQEWVELASVHCDRLRSNTRFLRIIFEASADQMWTQPSIWARRKTEEAARTWILKKWSVDFLGPWLMELGVPTSPEDIEQVMNGTGGWPALAVDLAKRFVHTSDWKKAVDSLHDASAIRREFAESMFIGSSEAASRSIITLKKLRQNQMPGEKILDSEIAAHAELIQVPETEFREILEVAETLGLIDRTDYTGRSWDPVFERLFLL